MLIAPASNSIKSSSARSNKLFKVTEDGYMLEVENISDDGTKSSITMQPTMIQDISSNYLMIVFINEGYLVDKVDGKVFELPEGDILKTYHPKGLGKLVREYSDYILYLNNTADIVKINIKNPESLTKEIYQATGDKVNSFCPDSYGNILYEGNDNGGAVIGRLKKAEGGLEILSAKHNLIFWEGFDEKLYFYGFGLDYIQEINNLNPYQTLQYGTTSINTNGLSNIFKISNSNKIIGIGSYNIIELYNEEGNPKNMEFIDFGLLDLKYSGSSDNYYYLGGTSDKSKPVLLRVNPYDNSYETIIDGNYDIYSISVGSNENIIFDALRLSDGKIVLGEVDANNKITIINESLDNKVVALERIK